MDAKLDHSAHVTLVEILDVLAPFDEVTELMRALMQRLEREGVPGIASMQFYTDEAARQLAAVIRFWDPAQLIDHTKLLSSWSEFARFSSMIELKEMRIHGVVPPAVLAWLEQFQGPKKQYQRYVAGFVRS